MAHDRALSMDSLSEFERVFNERADLGQGQQNTDTSAGDENTPPRPQPQHHQNPQVPPNVHYAGWYPPPPHYPFAYPGYPPQGHMPTPAEQLPNFSGTEPTEDQINLLHRLAKRCQLSSVSEFSGSDPKQAENWLRNVENVFESFYVPDRARSILTGFKLTKAALVWWKPIRRDYSFCTWVAFKAAFRDKWYPKTRVTNLVKQFRNFQQRKNESADAHAARFQELYNSFEEGAISKEIAMHAYIDSLNDELCGEVTLRRPQSFEEAWNYARTVEAISRHTQRSSQDDKDSDDRPKSSWHDKKKFYKHHGHFKESYNKESQQLKTEYPHPQPDPNPYGPGPMDVNRLDYRSHGSNKCYTCGNRGHYSPDCPVKQNNYSESQHY